jgi:hypothetical protein
MRKLCCFSGLLIFLSTTLFGQNALVFKGTVKCYISGDERSTKGAKNVIVVPGFMPQKSGMTGEQGYYEINTRIPLRKLEDKYVVLYYISSCKLCEKKLSVFVSADQARIIGHNGSDTLFYITVPTIKMNAGCKETELDPLKSDGILNNIVSKPGEDLEKVSPLNVVTAPPGLLNFITTVIAAPMIAGTGRFRPNDTAASIPSGNIHGYGKFLMASPMVLSGNTGFNFAPGRDRSEAVFWNPSAMGGDTRSAGIGLFTNFKNNAKLSFFKKINERVTLGAGGLYTQQKEFRKTVFQGLPGNDTVLHLRTLREFSAFVSASYQFNKQLSGGLAVKSIWQRFNLPTLLIISDNPDVNEFIDTTVTRQRFDADLSFSYAITPALKAGVNFMNLLGTKLYADAFGLRQPNIPYRQLRSLGVGLSYKWKQFNVGSDALITSEGLYELSLGASYVPFNNALVSAGYAFRQKGYTAGFKWKQFRVSYVNDNGFMVDDKNPGKSGILNGRIYTGAVVGF